jgi:hypothetical protein
MSSPEEILKVQLPRRFTLNEVHAFLASIVGQDGNPVAPEISFDFTTLTSWVEVDAIAALCSATLWLIDNGVAVKYRYPTAGTALRNTHPVKYLDDAGFFNIFLGKTLYPGACCRSTMFPLSKLGISESYSWMTNKLIPWLDRILPFELSKSFPEFEVCVQEVFNNIRDHSGKKWGCVVAQYYPNLNKIDLIISDYGVGIPANMRILYPGNNDAELIHIATAEGVSSKTTPANRGAGLENIISIVTNHANGIVKICSLHGELAITNDQQPQQLLRQSLFPGTLIHLTFKTDSIDLSQIFPEDLAW